MKKLTKEDIVKNNVDTIGQFKILKELKECLNIDEFRLYLYNDYTIKVFDKLGNYGYFEYDSMTNEVVYTDAEDYENDKDHNLSI